ncbi:hypothetical protein [Pseudomonas viridiflava]|uniref:hypothetical protein n=1 Tax=Pseudomonas viridiflava TaxID=33069 RepID=UPI002A69F044|nr:hypothetical protein [Pseudomonas viridiflava]MDY0917608.1 hypothetical protein [Pseudomonas viridiflava]
MSNLKTSRKIKKHAIKVFQFAMALGFVSVAITTAYNFIVEDVSLKFVKPFGRYSIFELENDSPSDQTIESFTVTFPEGQPLVARTTRDVYGNQSDTGEITLPGGNAGWIPTVEFSELNGQIISANKKKTFRLPPASSIDYLKLEAGVFDIKYYTHPNNKILRSIDDGLKWIGLKNTDTKIRYLMVNNYWSPTTSTSLNEALKLACRDDRSLGVGVRCPGD